MHSGAFTFGSSSAGGFGAVKPLGASSGGFGGFGSAAGGGGGGGFGGFGKPQDSTATKTATAGGAGDSPASTTAASGTTTGATATTATTTTTTTGSVGLGLGLGSSSASGFAGFGTAKGFGGFGSGIKDANTNASEVTKAVAIGQNSGGGGKEGKAGSHLGLKEEENQVTGEESEESVFTASGVLYEYGLKDRANDSGECDKTWKERGRGQVNLNVDKTTKKARLVMRTKTKVILNAKLWPEMVITRNGTNGVTFAAVNCLTEKEDSSSLSTYALRLAKTVKIEDFEDLLNKNKNNL